MHQQPRDPRVLVIDDDVDGLAAIVHALSERPPGDGFLVTTASDGAAGLAAAIEQTPDVIVASVDMQGMDGWTLVKHVRCRPALALIPFIFIVSAASAEDRLRGFQLGADDFVSKPLRTGELALRVNGSLERQARIVGAVQHHLRSSTAVREHVGIGGALEHVGLPALLTLLERERKTGVLSLLRRDPPLSAALYFRDGRLHDARLDGRRSLRRAEAVYDLLRWDTGRFEFVARPLEVRDQIGLTTTELLLEGARRIDDTGPTGL
jgi:DNA-binding response OmpR family regulator